MKKVLILIAFLIVSQLNAQLKNGGFVANIGFIPTTVHQLSEVPAPIPYGLQVVCYCDNMTHFWDGTQWRVFLDSVRIRTDHAFLSMGDSVTIYNMVLRHQAQYYPLMGNPSGYIGSGALSPYLTTSTAASTYQPIGSYLTSSSTLSWNKLSGTPTTLSGYGITNAYPLTGNPSGFLTTYSESDPVVKNINGIIKSNGTIISAAISGTDYLVPSSLSSYVPTTRQINGTALSSDITLTTSNIAEGSNLYFTNSKAKAAIDSATVANILGFWPTKPLSTDYMSIINQTGTSAPTSSRKDANFNGVTFTWARTSSGNFTLTASSGIFTTGKTSVLMSETTTGLNKINFTVTSTTVITFTTTILSTLVAAVLSDNVFTNTLIWIKVFN